MARGNIAKENLIKIFIKAAGENYIGCVDKKYIFLSDDGGEKVQIAITMTCPKNPIGEANTNPISTSAFGETPAPRQTQTEITTEEVETLEALMKKLGL